MRIPFSLIAVCLGCSLVLSSPALAAPVTDADLSGKKFCWNDGGTENYYPDGKYYSTHDGTGTGRSRLRACRSAPTRSGVWPICRSWRTGPSLRHGSSTAGSRPGPGFTANRRFKKTSSRRRVQGRVAENAVWPRQGWCFRRTDTTRSHSKGCETGPSLAMVSPLEKGLIQRRNQMLDAPSSIDSLTLDDRAQNSSSQLRLVDIRA